MTNEFELSSGRYITWETDEYAYPRKDYSPISTMYYIENRYFSLDAVMPSDFDPEEEKTENFVFPIYAMIHGAVAFSLTPFNDPWDSGLCGYAVVTKEQAAQFIDPENDGTFSRDKVYEIVKQEIDEINHYHDGNYCTIAIYNENDEIDDCIGGCLVTKPSDAFEMVLMNFELSDEEKEELRNLRK